MANPPPSGPKPGMFFLGSEEEQWKPHFLDACCLCKAPLGTNSDIYAYQGYLPFCSEACRLKQMVMDEVKEAGMVLSSAARNLTKPETDDNASSSNTAGKDPLLFIADEQQEPPVFREECYLCKAPLRHNTDTYVYQGDLRFCSEGCRKRQIVMDQIKEGDFKFLSSLTNPSKPKTDDKASSSKTA